MSIIINPGSGPVKNSTLENAIENMRAFGQDLIHGIERDGDEYLTILRVTFERDEDADNEGRFGFKIHCETAPNFVIYDSDIDMPGLPLEDVRFLGLPGQNIWDFPRLYVDGSSWVWKFALHMCGSLPEDGE